MRSNAVPQRILLVDDDELELELMAHRLQSAGYEIATASNGNEALERLSREWFPVVITDREMPVMNGLELTEQLRTRGIDDLYVIMLTGRDASADYERGYLAGADDYLTKNLPDADLLARIRKGFQVLAVRRSQQKAQAPRASQSLDPRSGAYTPEHLLTALRSECRRAERYERNLSVMTVALEAQGALVADATLRQVTDTIRATVRAHVDWVAAIESEAGDPVFVLVLPEAGAADALTIKLRLQRALRNTLASTEADTMPLSFGFASLDAARTGRKPAEPDDLLGVAERCRACLHSQGALQLTAVQASVAQACAIFCRHGYAVESHCRFMVEAPSTTNPAG